MRGGNSTPSLSLVHFLGPVLNAFSPCFTADRQSDVEAGSISGTIGSAMSSAQARRLPVPLSAFDTSRNSAGLWPSFRSDISPQLLLEGHTTYIREAGRELACATGNPCVLCAGCGGRLCTGREGACSKNWSGYHQRPRSGPGSG